MARRSTCWTCCRLDGGHPSEKRVGHARLRSAYHVERPQGAEVAVYLLIPLVLIAAGARTVWRVLRSSVGRADRAWNRRRQLGRRFMAGIRPRLMWNGSGAPLPGAALVRRRTPGHALGNLLGDVFLAIGTALATVDQDFTNLIFDSQILRGDFYC